MKNMLLVLALCISSTFLLSQTVSAAPPEAIDAINEVSGGNLSSQFVGLDAGGILEGAMRTFLPLANILALVILVLTGILLVVAQDENQISIARKTLFAVAGALVLLNTAVPLGLALTGGFNLSFGGEASLGASILSAEIIGFINFIEVPIASIAVVMIIISCVRAIATLGTDQGTTYIRNAVFSVIAGIIIITAKITLTTAIGANPLDIFIAGGGPDSGPFVEVLIFMMNIILSFMALAAVIVIVIAGGTMVVNKGDQDVAEKARGIIIRTLAGLFVIIISAALTMIILG